MKRYNRYVCILILIISTLLLLSGCAKQETANNSGDGENALNYRLADRNEGIELMMSNDEYYDGFSQNDLDYKMQKTGATMDEYKAFAKEQVLDFTDEQKAIIDEYMGRIEDVIKERAYQIPELDEIVFVNTTMKEECDAMAYTHGTQIYICGDALVKIKEAGDKGVMQLDHIFAHEVFHCLTRCNPDFRKDMYNIIHFTINDEDFAIPESVKEFFISNPDVEHHDAYASFIIDGKPIKCFTAFVTTKHFEKEGDSFFDTGTTALVPIDGTDKYYTPEDAENFDEVFGKNTGYVIDPEECMADNFSYLFAFGTEGPDGKGYPNPEIITSIEDILK